MIFIDTNVLVAYAVADDANHTRAVHVFERIIKGEFGRAFTSDYIFDETATVILARSTISKAIQAGELIRKFTEILLVNKDAFDAAWKLFKEQKSSRLSFTDCTAIVLMEQEGIQNIATFDREFEVVKSINVVR